jgi:hypothetical protein
MKESSADRLQQEYRRLVEVRRPRRLVYPLAGAEPGQSSSPPFTYPVCLCNRFMQSLPAVGGAGAAREDAVAAPVLPADAVDEVVPGSIRNADLFLRFMKQVCGACGAGAEHRGWHLGGGSGAVAIEGTLPFPCHPPPRWSCT